MKTLEFQKLVQSNPDKFIKFIDHQKEAIHASYHVSEIKSALYETVDCGAMAHKWRETILQLWLSSEADSELPMKAQKVFGIFEKVSELIKIDDEAEVRIEYGNEDFPPVLFHIESAAVEKDEIVVTLRVPETVCKLEERGGSCARPEPFRETEDSCCSGSSCCQ